MTDNVKILIVDDEEGVRESFKMILKIKDFEVDAYDSGESAVAALKKGIYSIAFVDYKLPGMDGIEVLKKIKEADPDIEVVIVTAYASESSHANAITLGALEYLRKPFLMEEIYELVERGLRKKRSKSSKPAESGGDIGPIH